MVWILTGKSEDFILSQAVSVGHIVRVLVEEQLINFWLYEVGLWDLIPNIIKIDVIRHFLFRKDIASITSCLLNMVELRH